MELDDNFKRLIKELGDAINESLSDSERIAEVMSRIRSAGYDLFLVLEVTIGFNKRGEVALFSFDRKGAKVLGEKKLCRQTLMHPTLANGRLYVRDGEFLYCYDLSDGQ